MNLRPSTPLAPIVRFMMMAALAVVSCAPASSFAAERILVEGGWLQGQERAGVRAFLGIPYAAPPVRELRWRAPNPVKPWQGVRSAGQFGASCLQPLAGSRLPWTEEFMAHEPTSEGCLFLNVWTAAAQHAKEPVFVFIHGGGFLEGSGAVAVYDGEALARRGVVVVTINYRVGPLGFLAHPALTAESESNSGNYGLLDQIAALRWVQKNIARFGGDPRQVTVGGQSAGAVSVALLRNSPVAQGLFARTIIESGPGIIPDSFSIRSRAMADQDGLQFAARMGATSLEELRALPAAKLVSWGETDPAKAIHPFVESKGLLGTGTPRTAVPLLIGMVSGDADLLAPPPPKDLAAYQAYAQAQFGSNAEQFIKLYPATSDADIAASMHRFRAERMRLALDALAAEQAQANPQVYLYYFDHPIPWPAHPEFGAFHSSEIPYAFGNLQRLDHPWTSIDHQLSDRMVGYWSNFIRTGNPNGKGLPRWSEFQPGSHKMMRLGDATEMIEEAPVQAIPLLQQDLH